MNYFLQVLLISTSIFSPAIFAKSTKTDNSLLQEARQIVTKGLLDYGKRACVLDVDEFPKDHSDFWQAWTEKHLGFTIRTANGERVRAFFKESKQNKFNEFTGGVLLCSGAVVNTMGLSLILLPPGLLLGLFTPFVHAADKNRINKAIAAFRQALAERRCR